LAALASLLTVLTLALLINRIASIALTLTGLSQESAQFQARSAYTGVGFTTNEAEQVVNHPVRRRILMLLMLLGNVGVITAISSLMLTFINTVGPSAWVPRLLILALGLVILWLVARSKWVDRYVSKIIKWALRRWTDLDVKDYASLLHLSGDYTVTELNVQPQDWLAHRPLSELNLQEEGTVVLGIVRSNGRYVGAPKGETRVYPDDTLLLYGRMSAVNQLSERRADRAGEAAHQRAMAEQRRVEKEQDRQELAEGA